MSESISPNEVLTPTYIGEELVYVPLLVYYMGEFAVQKYVANTQEV